MKTLLALLWLSTSVGAATSTTPVDDFTWPLRPQPSVVRHFEQPPERWAAGHRGVDLLGEQGSAVLAAGRGVVSHSGVIAGRGTVTVTHPDGRRTTYEPLDDRLPRGARVESGDRIGTLAQTGSHCAPRSCLHWGLVVGEREYRDPLTLTRPSRVVLLPLT